MVQSAKFELLINLKTARALGLTIPGDVFPSLMRRSNELLECQSWQAACRAPHEMSAFGEERTPCL